MKIKSRRVVEPPPAVKAIVDDILAAPLDDISVALQDFQWKFDKGDLHHWIPLLNHFDTYFDQRIKDRPEIKLEYEEAVVEPFPEDNVLAILKVTNILLEKCGSRHLYASANHLCSLLAAPCIKVLLAVLQTLASLTRRYPSHTKSQADAVLVNQRKRLFRMAQGWDRSYTDTSLALCASADTDFSHLFRTLHFEFYDAEAAKKGGIIEDSSLSSEVVGAPGVRRVVIDHVEQLPEDEVAIMRELVTKYQVPKDERFNLLTKVRVALAMRSQLGRQDLVRVRLLAFYAGYQTGFAAMEIMSFFHSEPEFVREIVGLLQVPEGTVPEDIQAVALRALGVQLQDRGRHPTIVTAVASGGPSSLLSLLMHNCVAGIRGQAGKMARGFAFIEALLSLVGALVTSTTGVQALADAGLIQALLPLLEDYNPAHFSIVSSTIRILESFMDFNPTSSELFRELGGLSLLLNRLTREVQSGSSDVEMVGGEHFNASGSSSSGGGGGGGAANTGEPVPVPYQRRILLKSLLRAIAMGSYSANSAQRALDEASAAQLYAALSEILRKSREYGGGLFSLAASVVSDLIHHDPLVYKSLDEAGLPDAFLESITKQGIVPQTEAVAAVPSTLGALCLNMNGMTKVQESKALECLIPVFTTKTYLRTLQAEQAMLLGGSLDELLRHSPQLRSEGIQVFIKILKRLCVLGGSDSVSLEDSPANMETTKSVEDIEIHEGSGTPPGMGMVKPEDEDDPASYLVECVTYTARMLEGVLQTPENVRRFTEDGGVKLLLQLYSLPVLPPTFGSTNASHSLLVTFRTFAQHVGPNSYSVATALKDELSRALNIAAQAAANIAFDVCVPVLEDTLRDDYIRKISTCEGLTALAAAIVRNASTMLHEIGDAGAGVILKLGKLERHVLWQSAVASKWKWQHDLSVKQQEEEEKAAIQSEATQEEEEKKKRKKTPNELAYEILVHFVHTARNFYQAVSKAVHIPPRRRDDASFPPTFVMQVASAHLASVMIKNIEFAGQIAKTYGGLDSVWSDRADRQLVYWRVKYIHKVLDANYNILFDSRRRTCHTLVLNYFASAQGLKLMLDQFRWVLDLLRALPAPPAAADPGEEEMASGSSEAESEVYFLVVQRKAIYSCLNAFLVLMANISHPQTILSSPNVVYNAVAPLPDYSPFADVDIDIASADDLIDFMRQLWVDLIETSLLLWESPQLIASQPRLLQSLVTVMRNCREVDLNKLTTLALVRARRAKTAYVNNCNQVIRRLREAHGVHEDEAARAIRRTGPNVEAAHAYLQALRQHQGSKEQAVDTAAIYLDLYGEAMPTTGPVHPVTRPSPRKLSAVDIVDGAMSFLRVQPQSVFYLSDLLRAHAASGPDERRIILDRIVNHHILKCIDGGSTCSTDLIFPPAHLLSVIVHESASAKETIAEVGAADVCCRALRSWSGLGTSVAVPRWVDSLLLVLDALCTTQPKHATPPPPPPPPPPLQQIEDEDPLKWALESVTVQWRLGGLLSDEELKFAGEECFKLLDHLARLPPSLSTKIDDEKKKGKKKAQSPSAVGDETDETWEEEQEEYVQPNAASTCHAVLQLLSRVTKRHDIAEKALAIRAHVTIMRLPSSLMGVGIQPFAASVLRHILEDCHTLQAAMESEIRNLMLNKAKSLHGHRRDVLHEPMSLKSFMQLLAPVAAREPKVFLEALWNTCKLFPSGTSKRVMVTLKSNQQLTGAGGTSAAILSPVTAEKEFGPTPPNKKKGGGPSEAMAHSTKGTSKGPKKVPPGLLAVIDLLLDTILKFDVSDSAEGSIPMEDGVVEPSHKASQEAASRQCFALHLLAEFTLMYQHCVGVLLKRDSDLLTKEVVNLSGGSTVKKRPQRLSDGLFKQLMDVHLSLATRSRLGSPQELAEASSVLGDLDVQGRASHLLLAVCIRSAEGRKRIVQEIVKTLLSEDATGECNKTTGTRVVDMETPFIAAPFCPPPYKVKAFVELAGSLLSAGAAQLRNAAHPPLKDAIPVDLVRAMRDAGGVKALTRALKLIDLEHPSAVKQVHAILRPLEILTRRVAKSAPSPGEKPVAQPDAPSRDGTALAARSPDQQTSADAEAGPQALAAANRVLEALDRDRARATRRSMEDMMEAMIESAYGEGYDGEEGSSMEEEEEEEDSLDESMGGSDSDSEMVGESSEEDGSGGDEHEDDDVPIVVEVRSAGMSSLSDGGAAGLSSEADDDDDDDDDDEASEFSDEGMSSDDIEGEDDIEAELAAVEEELVRRGELVVDDEEEEEEGTDEDDYDEEEEEEEEEDHFVHLGRSARLQIQGDAEEEEDYLEVDHGHPMYGEEEYEEEDDELYLDDADLFFGEEEEEDLREPAELGYEREERRDHREASRMLMEEFGFMRSGLAGRSMITRMRQVPGAAGIMLREAPPPAGSAGHSHPTQHPLLVRPSTHAVARRASGQGLADPRLQGGQEPIIRVGDGDVELEHAISAAVGPGVRVVPMRFGEGMLSGGGDAGGGFSAGFVHSLRGGGGPLASGGGSRITGNWADGDQADANMYRDIAGAVERAMDRALQIEPRDQGGGTTTAAAADNASVDNILNELTGAFQEAEEEEIQEDVPSLLVGHESAPAALEDDFTLAVAHPPVEPETVGSQAVPEAGAAGLITPGSLASALNAAMQQGEDAMTIEPEGSPTEIDEGMPATDAVAPSGDGAQGLQEGGGALQLDAAVLEAASAAGIDVAFLEALPSELRAEVLASAGVTIQGSATTQARDAAPGSSVDDGIDPEFLAALPPELQAEVREQARREQRMRTAAAARERAAAVAATGAGQQQEGGQGEPGTEPAATAEMDFATLLASFPPEVRDEALLSATTDQLDSLPPALRSEALNLRSSLGSRFHRYLAANQALGEGRIGDGDGFDAMPMMEGLGNLLLQRGGRTRRLGGHDDGGGMLGTLQRIDTGDIDAALARLRGETTSAKEEDEGPEPPVEVDEEDLITLVRLLRLSQPIGKGALQRLILNLCANSQTRVTLLQLIVSILRAPLSGDEDGSLPGAVGGVVSGLQLAKPFEGNIVPPLLSRRVLDLLTYLCKQSRKAPFDLAKVSSPPPEYLAQVLASHQQYDTKGKRKAEEAPRTLADGADVNCLQTLLAIPTRNVCRRSDVHMAQALDLLGGVLKPFEDKLSLERLQKDLGSLETSKPAQTDGEAAAPSDVMQTEGVVAGPVSLPKAESSSKPEASQEMQPIKDLPEHLLVGLAVLLTEEPLSSKSIRQLKNVMQVLCIIFPGHYKVLLPQLARTLIPLADKANTALVSLTGLETLDAHDALSVGIASAGELMLRVAACIWELTKQMVFEHRKERNKVEESEECRLFAMGTLEGMEAHLDPMWMMLSQIADRAEAKLKAFANTHDGVHTGKLLPPSISQLQSLVESFAVLTDLKLLVNAEHESQQEPPSASIQQTPGGLTSNPSWIDRASSMSPTKGGVGSGGGSGPESGSTSVQSSAPFLRFAEKHRRLVNALVRHKPELLVSSLRALLKAPRLLDFDNKRAYFRTKIKSERQHSHSGSLRLQIRRDYVFQDSFRQLRGQPKEALRHKLSIAFMGEEGVDAGGLTREWYSLMSREMFDTRTGLFQQVPDGGTTFQPNPHSSIQNDEAMGTNHLDFFKFVGRVVGKALHDGQHIDAHFTRSFYKHMLGQPLTVDDIEAVDPDLHKNLKWMLENDITDVLELTFSEEVDYFGQKTLVELAPGGASIKVTNENKKEYVNALARHRMTNAIRDQIDAFLGGFWDVVPKDLVSLFTDHELELLICGLPEIDVDDLRIQTEYHGFTAATPVVQWLWEIIREMDKEDLALLIQFVTGTSKVPLEGFKALQGVHGPQKFQIHKAYGDKDRLPSAHTCFNQLDLVEYDSKEQLRERLMTAIHEGSEGFGFA